MIIVDAVALLQLEAKTDNEALILEQILAAYPAGYQIENISRNRAREWVKTVENACIPWLKKTAAREREFLFTLPYMVEDSLQLVLANDSIWHNTLLSLQQPGQPISLARLLTVKPAPLIGVELNRTYGNTLDLLLAQRHVGWSVYTRTTSSRETGSMLPMLQRGFIDATLEYRKVAQRTGMALTYYPLLEAEPVNLVHFACSNGERGQHIVDLLNQVIIAKSQQAAYQQLVLQGIAANNRQRALQIWLQVLASSKQLKPAG